MFIENRPLMQTQRKTRMGINLLYDISKIYQGGNADALLRKPLVVKTAFGDEASKTLCGG